MMLDQELIILFDIYFFRYIVSISNLEEKMDPPMIKFSNDITNEFHDACVNGDLDKIYNLLREKELIDVKQLEEKDTLCISVKEGHEKVVKILLQIGVDANKGPNMSPLQWAIIFSGTHYVIIYFDSN